MLRAAVDEGWHRASTTAGRFAEFRGPRVSRWTIAALVEEGNVFGQLARVLVMAVPPRDDVFVIHPDAIARGEFLRRWLSTERDRAECRGITRYLVAVRQGRELRLVTPEYGQAHQQLTAAGPSRVAECVVRERLRDGTLLPFDELELSGP